MALKMALKFMIVEGRRNFTESECLRILDADYSLKRITKKYRVNCRTWYRCLDRYGLTDRWKERESARRSMRMRGNKNGSHPPSILPAKEELEALIKKGESAIDLMKRYGIGDRLFHRILEWHDLSSLWKKSQGARIPYRCLEHPHLFNIVQLIAPEMVPVLFYLNPA